MAPTKFILFVRITNLVFRLVFFFLEVGAVKNDERGYFLWPLEVLLLLLQVSL